MHIRRWVLTPLVLALFAGAAVSLAPVLAQQKKDKKLEKAQQLEVEAALKIANAVAAGEAVASEITPSLRTDFMKAQEGRTYVPFTVSIDPAQLPSKSIAMYLRVVSRNAPVPAAAPAKADTTGDKPPAAAPEYAYQEVYFADVKTPPAGEPYRVSRAFAVPAGDYDVYVVVKERAPASSKGKAPAPKSGYLKQQVTVPNYWTADLMTSSVIVAAQVEPLAAPLSAQEQVEQPYTFGTTQIVPVMNPKFTKTGEVSVVFLIYNTAQDANKKPDVAVEYSFYQKLATAEKGEKFFNKTSPQAFNAATLPPQFDSAAGHQLVAGQSVPLASFPEGDYRLEIKVTDRLSGKTLTQNVVFKVTS